MERSTRDVTKIMDEMMKIQILGVADGSAMNGCRDPNMTMDLRHKRIVEPLPAAVTESAVVARITRILMDEESRELYRKREQELLEKELKKFERALGDSRPRFRGPYERARVKILDRIEDYDKLWKMPPRMEIKVQGVAEKRVNDQPPNDVSSIETIKVTIKDKPTCGFGELEILRMAFDVLKNNARESSRLREAKLRIQEKVASRRVAKYFNVWRKRVQDSKKAVRETRAEEEISEEKRIELLVEAISEKQKRMRESTRRVNCPREVPRETSRNVETGKLNLVQSIARSRLDRQKKIIEQQRMKLVEQNRIIEELRLDKLEDEAKRASCETMNVAREALAHCGQRTRTSLMRLVRQEGSKSVLEERPRIPPSPPRFLLRMEARAQARRERVRRAEEDRKRKLEEQEAREEKARREQEDELKRQRLEAQREAKRIREEQERKRAQECERRKLMNEMADNSYRRYLLRRYIMEPMMALVDLKRNYTNRAIEHRNRRLLMRAFDRWNGLTRHELHLKLQSSLALWRRNLQWWALKNWHEITRREIEKAQVAADHYELRLVDRCLKFWRNCALESRMRNMEKEKLAISHLEMRRKSVCFARWRKYLTIAGEIRESDRTRDTWRMLVQRVVPDFDPKQRGVIVDD